MFIAESIQNIIKWLSTATSLIGYMERGFLRYEFTPYATHCMHSFSRLLAFITVKDFTLWLPVRQFQINHIGYDRLNRFLNSWHLYHLPCNKSREIMSVLHVISLWPQAVQYKLRLNYLILYSIEIVSKTVRACLIG
jgi:hypothetical protein